MGKPALLAVIAGGASALMAAAAFSGAGGVLIAYFAPLPLFLAGLALGLPAAAIAAAAGSLVAGLGGGTGAALVFVALNVLPSLLVIHQALRPAAAAPGGPAFAPIGRALAMLALLIALTLVALSLFAGADGGLQPAVHRHLGEVFALSLQGLDAATLESLVDKVAPLFLGLSAAIWLLMISLNAAVAEILLARRGRALRPEPAWSALALPDWLAWPLVGCAVVALAASGDFGFVARNAVLVLAAAYFLQGLATLHSLTRGRPGRRPLLILLYLLLGLAFVFAAPVIAGIGMIDQWAGLRPRPPRPPRIKE